LSVTNTGFNIHSISVILMIVGAIGLLVSIRFWSSWGGGGYRRQHRVTRDGAGGYAGEDRGETL
jgi:hypothetical protein